MPLLPFETAKDYDEHRPFAPASTAVRRHDRRDATGDGGPPDAPKFLLEKWLPGGGRGASARQDGVAEPLTRPGATSPTRAETDSRWPPCGHRRIGASGLSSVAVVREEYVRGEGKRPGSGRSPTARARRGRPARDDDADDSRGDQRARCGPGGAGRGANRRDREEAGIYGSAHSFHRDRERPEAQTAIRPGGFRSLPNLHRD